MVLFMFWIAKCSEIFLSLHAFSGLILLKMYGYEAWYLSPDLRESSNSTPEVWTTISTASALCVHRTVLNAPSCSTCFFAGNSKYINAQHESNASQNPCTAWPWIKVAELIFVSRSTKCKAALLALHIRPIAVSQLNTMTDSSRLMR